MSEQQRTPSGVPTGGQFAATEKSEAGISLAHLDGSFLYPPVFSSGAEVIEFWSQVEIPDEVLARAEHLYVERREDVRADFPAEAWANYGRFDWADENPQPDPSDLAATADWEGRQRAAQVDYETARDTALASRPQTLDRRDVRPLVRAAAMIRTAAEEIPDATEYHAVCQHEVSLVAGKISAHDAAMNSGMLSLTDFFLDANHYDLDRTAEAPSAAVEQESPTDASKRPATVEDVRRIVDEVVGAHIYNQNVALDVALDELTDNIGSVGTAVIDAGDPSRGRRRGRG